MDSAANGTWNMGYRREREREYLQEALASGLSLTRPFCLLSPVWLPFVVSMDQNARLDWAYH